MNIRNAFLRAADHIERNPKDYDFCNNEKPTCDTPGCLIGWVGVFAQVQARSDPGLYTIDVAKAIGHSWQDIAAFANERGLEGYSHIPEQAAKLLRAFAEEHFPADSIPASVRAIFEAEQSAAVC
jgi:hypothetical protein